MKDISIMGIINITDDSYFSNSRCPDPGKALERIETMVSEGADIIDIGACSTRPGSTAVSEEEEWRRLEPALRAIREVFPNLRISIDTFRSRIVRNAHDLLGDFIVNDISSGEDDPMMLSLVGELGLTYIAMHKRGDSRTMQQMCTYEDVTAEVIGYFENFAQRAAEAGIRKWILDPGFGFAKTVSQNYQLLKDLRKFNRAFGSRIPEIMVGVSRKSMIYKLFDITPEEALPQTQVLHLKALQEGASILRVHDVAEAVRTVELYRRMC